MIKLYGAPNTRAVRALWVLEELGLDYEYTVIDLLSGEGQSAEFLSLNPNGKVPVLLDGDLTLLETNAICTYLADRSPQAGLVPLAGTIERARYDQWCAFQLSELEVPAWMLTKNRLLYPDGSKLANLENPMAWEARRAENVLMKGLEGKQYILGDHFTVADIHLAITLLWSRHSGFKNESALLQGYLNRCVDRAAFEKLKTMGQLSDLWA